MFRLILTVMVIVHAAAVFGCSRTEYKPKPPEAPKPAPGATATQEAPAATAPSTASATPGVRTAPEEVVPAAPIELDPTRLVFPGATAPKPASWTWTPPTRQFRMAQYIVPARDGSGDAAELVMSHFAAGDGGPLDSNIQRWAGQFSVDGVPPEPQVSTRTIDGLKVTLVELRGDYTGMFQNVPQKDQLQLAAIVETNKGNTFIRLIGPAKTVEAHRVDWNATVDGLKRAPE